MEEERSRLLPAFRSAPGLILGAAVVLSLAAGPRPTDLRSNVSPERDPMVFQNGAGAEAALPVDEGGTVLEPGFGWESFTWFGVGPVFDREGPFFVENVAPVTLRITDDYCAGDRFRIFDNGVEIAETFNTHQVHGNGIGPDAAFRDNQWTSGIYSLPPGRHELRIQAADNPWSMGRGFVRVDPEYTFAAVAPQDIAESYREIHGTDTFRYVAGFELGAGSDGILPNFEEVVISFGRYLEVIPAGAFVCNAVDCLYTSDGPGITRAIIRAEGLFFEADHVDLCPAQNPLVLGVWIGNDGGSVRLRCEGNLHD